MLSLCCRYPLACDESEDVIELESADHTEGVSGPAVIHFGDDDDDDRIYDIAGVSRGTESNGASVTCVQTKTSVKQARVHKALATTDGDGSDSDGDDSDGGVSHLDDDVYDMGGVAGMTIRAPEGGIIFSQDVSGSSSNDGTNTDPTYDILGAADHEDESQS